MGILVSLIDRLFTSIYPVPDVYDLDTEVSEPLLTPSVRDPDFPERTPSPPQTRSRSPPPVLAHVSRTPAPLVADFASPASLLSTPSPLDAPDSFDVSPPTILPPPPSASPPPSPSDHFLADAAYPPVSPPPPSQSPPPPDARAGPPALQITIPPPDQAEPLAPPDGLPSPDSLDLSFDDEGLTTLEKIYLFSRSQANFHKVFITHAMPSILPQVSAVEAVEYVLPLLNGLATDDDAGVKEALATELVPIIWWFTSNCRLTDDESADPTEEPTPLFYQAFTPILGTLLLSHSAAVGAAARLAIVEILRRVRTVDAQAANVDTGVEIFGLHERRLLEHEILQQIVIGIGRLDLPDDAEEPALAMDVASDEAGPQESDTLTPSTPRHHTPSPTTHRAPHSSPPNLPLPMSPPMLAAFTDDASPDFTPPELSPDADSLSPPSPPSPIPPPRQFNMAGVMQDAEKADSEGDVPMEMEQEMTVDTVVADWIPASAQSPVVKVRAPSPPPPAVDPPEALRLRPLQPLRTLSSGGGSADENTSMDVNASEPMSEDDEGYEDDASEQAAVGRLTSMSLMAAVSASGYLEDETKSAFVREVERVGRDPVYWVRKEVSYALGALAKVVPVEVVHMTLLPLFDSLSTDYIWHVRHSALFALPAILSRLSPNERRTLALRTIMPLATDTSLAVRIRVLEALGEVMYAFRDDPGGPPDEILRLFLGKHAPPTLPPAPAPVLRPERPPGSVFDEPSRPLICAFNLPAVALTLGAARWPELRALYAWLGACEAVKVRRTLAASAGELARIVGPTHAVQDVLQTWRGALGAPEVEVRLRAVGAAGALLGALPGAERSGAVRLLGEKWAARTLGWKEREALARMLVSFVLEFGVEAEGAGGPCELLARALEDEVAAVREAAVHSIPHMLQALAGNRPVWEQLNADVRALARSGTFRRRMTFVACYQALLGAEGCQSVCSDNAYWQSLLPLVTDPIVDVRIGVARLVGTICDRCGRGTRAVPPNVEEVAQRLRGDASHGVRAYVPVGSVWGAAPGPADSANVDPGAFATFSRPPPPAESYAGPAQEGHAPAAPFALPAQARVQSEVLEWRSGQPESLPVPA